MSAYYQFEAARESQKSRVGDLAPRVDLDADYAWAERAFSLGMPERLAMVALGHNSSAIHRVYPKGATIVAPSLNGFQASFPKPAEASYQRAESAY